MTELAGIIKLHVSLVDVVFSIYDKYSSIILCMLNYHLAYIRKVGQLSKSLYIHSFLLDFHLASCFSTPVQSTGVLLVN